MLVQSTTEIVSIHPACFLFRIPHMPPSGSLKVLHAPVRRGGIRRASQTKIYNLETDDFVSNPPFSKIYPKFRQEQLIFQI
jgi:hypothetical protein